MNKFEYLKYLLNKSWENSEIQPLEDIELDVIDNNVNYTSSLLKIFSNSIDYTLLINYYILLKKCIPDLPDNFNVCLQRSRYHMGNVLVHSALAMNCYNNNGLYSSKYDAIVRLALLFHDTGKTIAKEMHIADENTPAYDSFKKHPEESEKIVKKICDSFKMNEVLVYFTDNLTVADVLITLAKHHDNQYSSREGYLKNARKIFNDIPNASIKDKMLVLDMFINVKCADIFSHKYTNCREHFDHATSVYFNIHKRSRHLIENELLKEELRKIIPAEKIINFFNPKKKETIGKIQKELLEAYKKKKGKTPEELMTYVKEKYEQKVKNGKII